MQAFHLRRDGEQIAVVQTCAPMSEFSVPEAQATPAKQHLAQAQQTAHKQAQAMASAEPVQAVSARAITPEIGRVTGGGYPRRMNWPFLTSQGLPVVCVGLVVRHRRQAARLSCLCPGRACPTGGAEYNDRLVWRCPDRACVGREAAAPFI